jgi:hypothetical protein
MLPLPSERGTEEWEMELRKVLGALSKDVELVQTPLTTGATASPFATQLELPAKNLAAFRDTETPTGATNTATAWNEAGEILFKWDAAFQDILATSGVELLRAYELGRALSDIYWALIPSTPSAASLPQPNCSWEFLLGDERVETIDTLLRTLESAYFPTTAPVVAATIHAWAVLVARGDVRTRCGPVQDVMAKLAAQLHWWHELLVTGVDPETLLKPYAGQPSRKISWKALRRFAPEALLAGGGFLALFGLALGTVQFTASGWLKVVLAAVGVLGISVGGIQAAVKNAAQSLFGRLKMDLYADLVITAVTELPDVVKTTKTLKKAVHQGIAGRSVTSSLPISSGA